MFLTELDLMLKISDFHFYAPRIDEAEEQKKIKDSNKYLRPRVSHHSDVRVARCRIQNLIMVIWIVLMRALAIFAADTTLGATTTTKCPPGEQTNAAGTATRCVPPHTYTRLPTHTHTHSQPTCKRCAPGFFKSTMSKTSYSCNIDGITWSARRDYRYYCICSRSNTYDPCRSIDDSACSFNKAANACLQDELCRSVYLTEVDACVCQ